MRKIALLGMLAVLLQACGGRLYAPVSVLLPPEPPPSRSGVWIGGEIARVPAQYPGEGGNLGGVSVGGTHISRWIRADLGGFLLAGSYHYTDPSFTGDAPFLCPLGVGRASILIPVSTLRLEAGFLGGFTAQLGTPEALDMLPFSPLFGAHVGMGIPGRFWVRLGYGVATTGIGASVVLSKHWTVGGSYVRWWEAPEDHSFRFMIIRTWR